jgi:hypothetical protein
MPSNNNTADYLSYASQVFVLSNGSLEESTPDAIDGYIQSSLNSVSSEASVKDPEDAMDSISRPTVKEAAAQISKENQINDLTRATGDSTVYKYYMQSIGWQKILSFIFFVTLNVFCSTFSRMYPLIFSIYPFVPTKLLHSEIWLEWWAAGNGTQNALYVTVYFMLAVFNSVGNGGYVW